MDAGITDCRSYQWDQDRDGQKESWSTCSTPECGCMCPVVGGILTVTANGEEKSYAVYASCQSGYGQGSEPAGDGQPVRFTPIAWYLPIQPAIQLP